MRTFQTMLDVGVSGAGVVTRRGFIRSLAGVAGGLALGWRDFVTARADELAQTAAR